MKLERLLGIVMILLRREKVTAPELAERFEVSRRTINRDIEEICRAGIPLITTQGQGGGISIAKGYKVEATVFSEDEMSAIFTALQGLGSVLQGSEAQRIFEKLARNGEEETDKLTIDLASHHGDSLGEKLEGIKKAIAEKKRISFLYYTKRGEEGRKIAPYRLLYLWSDWYIFGFCLKRRDFRLFKLNRLWELKISEEVFTPIEVPKESLDFTAFFSYPTYLLKARFSPAVKYRLIEDYGLDSFSVLEGGALLLEREFVSYENMKQWVLSFGKEAEVLEPMELRTEIQEEIQLLFTKYFKHDI